MAEEAPDIVVVERPAQGNRSMLIADSEIRERVREITFGLIGQGEPLA